MVHVLRWYKAKFNRQIQNINPALSRGTLKNLNYALESVLLKLGRVNIKFLRIDIKTLLKIKNRLGEMLGSIRIEYPRFVLPAW